jgi:hypothetical protein
MTVNKFAERIINYYKKLKGSVPSGMVVYYVEQLLKEHNDDTKGNEENSNRV